MSLSAPVLIGADKQNAQDAQYKLSVIPSGAPVLSVEAYSTYGWGALSHEHLGLKAWGASGPYDQVYAKFGLTPEGIADKAGKVVAFYKKRGHPVYSPLISALDEVAE
jgi:transketolase